MPTLTRYVSRVFLSHLVLMLFGFVALLQLLDLLNNADEIIQRHGESAVALVRYAALRLPELVTFLLPFSVLMASLLALARLAQQNEVLALKASGMSFYRLVFSFAPAALAVAALHLLLSDQVTPLASRALVEWETAAEAAAEPEERPAATPTWLRDESRFVRVGRILEQGRRLEDVILFERDADGILLERITARSAEPDENGWLLSGVERLVLADRRGGEFVRSPRLRWETRLTPQHFADLAAPPNTLSLRELIAFVTNPGLGSHPHHYYETWMHKRLAIPVASFLMILLAAPVAQGMQRHGGLVAGMAAGVCLGFLYFVSDGLVLALGEAGALPPALAAWSPALLFASIGGATLIRLEGH